MESESSKGENNIQIQIDTFTNRQFNFFSSIVMLVLGSIFLLAANTPIALIYTEKAPSECYSPIYDALGYSCAAYDLTSNPVYSVKISQLLINNFIILQISPLQTKFGQRTTISVPVEVSAYSIVSESQAALNPIIFKEKRELSFECSFSQYAPCNYEQVIDLQNINSNDHYIVMKFLQFEESANGIKDFDVQVVTLNQSFRYYFIFMKFILLICAIGIYFWKTSKMQKLDQTFYSSEHKAIQFVTPIIIFINIPFDGSVFDSFIYNVLQITSAVFLSTILLWLWLSQLYQIAGLESSVIDQSSKFIKFYLIVYFAISWLTYVDLGTSITKDPLSDFNCITHGFFNLLKFCLYVTLLAGLGWSSMKIANIVKRINELSQREIRFFWFSAVFMILQFYLIGTGGLHFKNLDGAKFLLFSGVSILYTAALCYMFVPTEEGLKQAQHIKKYDNPAAKEAYKDLEMSDDGAHKKNAAQDGNFETYHQLNHQTATKNNEVGQAYPFESNREEEL